MAEEKKETDGTNNAGFWGAVAGGIADLGKTVLTDLNPKVRDHELQMAQLQAQTAASEAEASKNQNALDPKFYIIIILVVLAVIALLYFLNRRS